MGEVIPAFKDSQRFLSKIIGIVIDHHLSWHDHIDYVCDKVSRSINFMTKVKRFMGRHCLIRIYYSLVYFRLIYGCSLWGNNYDSYIHA